MAARAMSVHVNERMRSFSALPGPVSTSCGLHCFGLTLLCGRRRHFGCRLRLFDKEERPRKLMVTRQIQQDKWRPILKKWSSMTPQERADAGKGVKIVGRWHDLAGRRRVAIIEAADAADAQRYLGQWNPFMDLDMTPVRDDEASAALAKSIADHGA